MKFFRKYISPALYGLLVYFTVRLLHDTEHDEMFWKRDWGLNILEMSCSVLVGYTGIYIYEWLFRFYDRRWPLQFNYRGVVRELIILVFANLVLVNLIFTPMAALTDDGLSWGDLADLTMIPTLYAIIYYGIARSSTWLKAYIANKVQLEKLTTDQLETELKFLKAQYHPHFLFNALNTIYFQMDEDVPAAKQSTELLSSLLRYQLYDQQQQVPISHELEYLQNYIRFQQIRASSKLKLNVRFDGRLAEQPIYPLLLLPLVENAFKYAGGDFEMRINANLNDGKFIFAVVNDVPAQIPPKQDYTGIGLENLRRRLQLLYPDKHKITFGRAGDRFFGRNRIDFLSMGQISCIITDDEPFARKGLQGYVEQTSFFDLKAQCEDAMELSEVLKQQPVDLLFLDIQMPHLSGVDFIKSLQNPPKVIFTTAFKEYATDGFDLDVLDYLLKPISFERFMKAAFKAKDYFDQKGSGGTDMGFLFVKSDGKLEKVVFDELLFVQGMENYVVIQTINKRLITHSTLKAFGERLPQRKFLQTHKSYFVAYDKVNSIDGNMLDVGMHQVPISRQLRQQVMELLINSRK